MSLTSGQRLVKLSEQIIHMLQLCSMEITFLVILFFFPSRMFWLSNSKELSIFTFSSTCNI